MSIEPTWAPHARHGRLTTQSDLAESVYAFPLQGKEPLTDATHIRNALPRFLQVEGVSDADRDLANAKVKPVPRASKKVESKNDKSQVQEYRRQESCESVDLPVVGLDTEKVEAKYLRAC